MAKGMVRVPVREQDPKVRATNFEEVCLGYNQEEAMEEATRCLNCKNAKCIEGCPVSINIPAFVQEVKEGNIEEAYKIIGQSSALPAICGRVCPQESQCEGKCIRGIKGDPVSMPDTVMFFCTVVLSCKSIQGRSKTVRSIPGNRFNLATNTLSGNGSSTKTRNHSCKHHGDHAVDHTLYSSWKTDPEDIFIKFSGIT